MNFFAIFVNWGHFFYYFYGYGGHFDNAAIMAKSAYCQKKFFFVFLSSYTTNIPKIKKFGEMSLPEFGTLSLKVGLKYALLCFFSRAP